MMVTTNLPTSLSPNERAKCIEKKKSKEVADKMS